MKKIKLLTFILLLTMVPTMFISCKNDNLTKKQLREKYFGQEKVDIVGSSEDLNSWIYMLKDSKIMVREVVIDSGKGGEPVTISQLTDLHFNYCNEEDLLSGSLALKSTHRYRLWLANGESVPKAEKCLEMASTADQMILTGDVLDYLSLGAMELMQKHIWDKYPQALACLGNHESTRVCQGKVQDETTLESRLAILEDFWIHDMYYTSRVINDKVMVIQLDNGTNDYFWESQIEPFKADLELARREGYVVLLFYHVPLATNNGEPNVVFPLRYNAGVKTDFSDFGRSHKANEATAQVYNLIINNADVIKGTFCGHLHSDYYTEIIAKNSDGTDAVIPQYILTGVPYDEGHILWITVK